MSPGSEADRFAGDDGWIEASDPFPAGAGRTPRRGGPWRDRSERSPGVPRRQGWSRAGPDGASRRWDCSELIFRKAIAWAVLVTLAGALHLIGINAHLPHIKLQWPWQTIARAPPPMSSWARGCCRKSRAFSRPGHGELQLRLHAQGEQEHRLLALLVYSTFYAVGHASATVDLNPGTAWWKPATSHYKLDVLSRPAGGKAGSVSVSIALPPPQLPQSVHDVSIDNTLSQPIATQHSWTYPGFGCGALLKPQFAESALYSQAQSLAFYRATRVIGDPAADRRRRERGSADHQEHLHPAAAERARLHAGRIHPALVRRAVGGSAVR